MSLPMRSSSGQAKPAGFPATRPILAACQCGEQYTPVHAAQEFMRAIRQLEELAGVTLPDDLPFLTHRCKRGHYLIIPVAQLR